LNTTDHAVLVNGIVVGETSQGSDWTAAMALSKKIAEVATYTTGGETTTTPTETCTDVTATTAGGDIKKFDTIALAGAFTNQAVSYTNLDALTYISALTYTVGGITADASAKESLYFTTTPVFDIDKDVQRLNAEIAADGLDYNVDFGTGIDFNLDHGFTGTTWTDVDSSDAVEIPFMGKTYVVHKVTLSTNITQLELFEKNSLNAYTVGSKIENLKGKDGKAYYVTVDGVDSKGTLVQMSLYDAATGVVLSEYSKETVSASGKFAESVLDGIVEVITIGDYSNDADLHNWEVEIAVGNEAITVYTGKGYPYDSTITSTSDYDFDATIASSGALLTSIQINNTSKYDFRDEEGLKPGDSVVFPGNLASLKFVGLQLPEFNATNQKEIATVQIGADVDDGFGKGIIYMDTSETIHEVPFFYEFDLDDVTAADDDEMAGWTNAYKVDNFVFDGITYSLKVAWESDENATVWIYAGDYSESATTELDSKDLDLNQDSATTAIFDVIADLDLINSEDVAVKYAVGLDTSEEKLFLLLDDQTIDGQYGDIVVLGTDINGESTIYADTTTGGTFYMPGEVGGDFATMIENTVDYNTTYVPTETIDEDYASLFKVQVLYNTDKYIDVVINSATGEVIQYGASTNSPNGIPGPAYQAAYSDNGSISATLRIREGATNGLEMFYDTYGTKVYLDEAVLNVTVPEAQAKVEIQAIGGTITTNADGKVCTTEDVETTTPVTTAKYTGAELSIMDASKAATTGNYIVIGGWAVNTLFPPALTERLAKEGDKVSEVVNGDVILAGFTANDTTQIVDDLIAALEAADLELPE